MSHPTAIDRKTPTCCGRAYDVVTKPTWQQNDNGTDLIRCVSLHPTNTGYQSLSTPKHRFGYLGVLKGG
eukprot:3059907-Pyramimonas_sp.AAC.1